MEVRKGNPIWRLFGGIIYIFMSLVILRPFITSNISGNLVILFFIGIVFFVLGIILLSSIFIRRLL